MVLPISQRYSKKTLFELHTGLAGRHNSGHKRKPDRTRKKLFDALSKLGNAGHQASERKPEFFLNKLK